MTHRLPTFTLCSTLLFSATIQAAQIDTTPASHVDLGRYLGLWHETARFDNIFERGLHAVTAVYEKLADGNLRVTNTGTAPDGERYQAIGQARQQEGEGAGYLEVSFVPPYNAFFSDYRILYVTPDYSGALVSDADGSNLWLLERSEEGNPKVLQRLLKEAEQRGFDTSELIYSSEGAGIKADKGRDNAAKSESEVDPE